MSSTLRVGDRVEFKVNGRRRVGTVNRAYTSAVSFDAHFGHPCDGACSLRIETKAGRDVPQGQVFRALNEVTQLTGK